MTIKEALKETVRCSQCNKRVWDDTVGTCDDCGGYLCIDCNASICEACEDRPEEQSVEDSDCEMRRLVNIGRFN